MDVTLCLSMVVDTPCLFMGIFFFSSHELEFKTKLMTFVGTTWQIQGLAMEISNFTNTFFTTCIGKQ